ncbi:MAG: Fic family protein [Chloroflexi bacterium]|nr:Fic family protein [Chloroflexota bacterium]
MPAQMDDWASWLQVQEGMMEPVALAALAHHQLVAIHPFIDGNGRTARLLTNLTLLRAGYPPAIIARVNRRQYYRVLAQADRGNATPLVNFVGRAVERSLTLYLEACTPQITLAVGRRGAVAAAGGGKSDALQPGVPEFSARTGKLEAIKHGSNWLTTRQALEAYLHSVGKTRDR